MLPWDPRGFRQWQSCSRPRSDGSRSRQPRCRRTFPRISQERHAPGDVTCWRVRQFAESPQNRADSGPPSSLDAELANKHSIFQPHSHSGSPAALVRLALHRRWSKCTSTVTCRAVPTFAASSFRWSFLVRCWVMVPDAQQDGEQLLVLDSPLGLRALMIDRVIAIDAIESARRCRSPSGKPAIAVVGTATYQSFMVFKMHTHSTTCPAIAAFSVESLRKNLHCKADRIVCLRCSHESASIDSA